MPYLFASSPGGVPATPDHNAGVLLRTRPPEHWYRRRLSRPSPSIWIRAFPHVPPEECDPSWHSVGQFAGGPIILHASPVRGVPRWCVTGSRPADRMPPALSPVLIQGAPAVPSDDDPSGCIDFKSGA